MTAAILFALYAAAAGLLAPPALRGRWVTRSPRLAIFLWLVLPVSWVTAVVMAVLAATAPFPSGRPGPEQDVVVLDHDAPAVYCLTSGRDRIVVSAGAPAALTPEQVKAVLAHERAHLRCHHHAMLVLTTGLARAFPWVPLLARARGQLGALAARPVIPVTLPHWAWPSRSCRVLLDRSETRLREEGRLGLLPHVLGMQVQVRLALGDWERAAAAAEEGRRLGGETGQPILVA